MLIDCSEKPALPKVSRGSWALGAFLDLPVPDGGRSLWKIMFPAEPHRSQDLWDERLCFHLGGGNPADSQHVFGSKFPFEIVIVVLQVSVQLDVLWLLLIVLCTPES